MDECPICLQHHTLISIKPCTHRFCTRCICKWLQNKSNCPLCKCMVLDLGLSNTCDVRIPPYSSDVHFGITLTNNATDHIIIKHVNSKDIAYRHGLRIGDKICMVNDIPLNGKHHSCVIAMINDAKRLELELRICLETYTSCFGIKRDKPLKLRRS